MEDCVFCRIARGQAPARILFSSEDVVAFHDVSPQAPTHVLVIPRQHITSLAEIAATDTALLGQLMLACADAARECGIAASGFRVVTNSGARAGQSVPHLHLHVLGGRAFGWPPG